jgi:large subunit ribosomal protein L2
MYLPKNKPVSLVELIPYKGVQYIRSLGSFGILLKMDLRINTALIKLPSGVRKVVSTRALGSTGAVALPINKNFKNNLAGFRKNKGFKSIVRGVAMNPVDHPHGGRAKAIKYQRTP